MRRAVLALLVLALAGTAYAQSTLGPNEVYDNQRFQLSVPHDGLKTTSYELYQGATKVQTKPVAERGTIFAGEITFESAPLAVGTYTFKVTAVGTGGSTSTANYTLVVKAYDLAPNPFGTPIRLIKLAIQP